MTGLSPDALVNDLLEFFLEETRVLQHNLARLGVTKGPLGAPPLLVVEVNILRQTVLALQEVQAVVTCGGRPDPRRGEGRELARAHHAVSQVRVALGVLEYRAEKWLKSVQSSKFKIQGSEAAHGTSGDEEDCRRDR